MRIRIVVGSLVLLGLAVFGYQQVAAQQRLARDYADAVAAADREEWRQAVPAFEAIAKSQPGYQDSTARLATARRELHLVEVYDAALGHYRAAQWPDAVAQLESLATEAPAYKDVAARLADARRQLTLQRQYDDATAKLAAKDFAGAIAGLQAVGASDSSSATQARAQLVQAQKDYASSLLARAAAAERAKQWPDLERTTRLALQQDPQVAGAQRLLGLALSRLGRYPEARQALALATSRDPKDAQAYNLLGWAHQNGSGGDQALADRSYRTAIQLDPKLANAFAGLGGLQLTRGQHAEAEATFQQALALDDTEAAAQQGLGLLRLNQKDYAGAEAHFRSAILAEPPEVVFHLNLARALRAQQRFDEARQELDRSKQLEPEDPDVDAAFGIYYTQTEQYQEALAAYEAAILRRPDQADYHVGLANTLLDLNRADDALREGDRTVELGEVSLGHLLRGYALAHMKQFDEARVAARLALDADPTNPGAQTLLQELAD